MAHDYGVRLLAAPLMLAALHAQAQAQQKDGFTPSASYAVQTDSNLFRLPASANVQAQTGSSSAAEQIGISTLGLGFNTTQSLQKIALSASVVKYHYQNFNYLSFQALNYDAAWQWAITPRFTGTLSADRKETLNSFADYSGYTSRNQRTDTNNRFEALYEVDGPWRLLGGVGQVRQYNEQALLAGGDYANVYSNAGVRRQFASGSVITYRIQLANGRYLNRTLPSAGFYDDGFKQVDNELRVRWVLSGSSNADFFVVHINRTHPNYSQRDYSGFNSSASVFWAITGKSDLAAGYSHTLDAYATANSNYSQADTLYVQPTWQVSPKVVLRLRNDWTQLQYLGSPAAAVSSTRQDMVRSTSLSVAWQPTNNVSFSTALQNASRGSSLANLDYASTSVNLTGQLSF